MSADLTKKTADFLNLVRYDKRIPEFCSIHIFKNYTDLNDNLIRYLLKIKNIDSFFSEVEGSVTYKVYEIGKSRKAFIKQKFVPLCSVLMGIVDPKYIPPFAWQNPDYYKILIPVKGLFNALELKKNYANKEEWLEYLLSKNERIVIIDKKFLPKFYLNEAKNIANSLGNQKVLDFLNKLNIEDSKKLPELLNSPKVNLQPRHKQKTNHFRLKKRLGK